MYEKYPKTCISICILCILAYIFTPEKGMKVSIPEVSAKEAQTATGKTATGVSMEIQTTGKEDSKKGLPIQGGHIFTGEMAKSTKEKIQLSCNAECKVRELIKLGIRDDIASSLITNCKALADDPRKCVIIGASIVKNESGGGYKCKKKNPYNCFGLSVQEDYKSYNDGVIHWIGKYNRFWFKAKDMSHFYSPAGELPPTQFCVSEDSTGTAVGCPSGLKNSTIIFNKLNQIF